MRKRVASNGVVCRLYHYIRSMMKCRRWQAGGEVLLDQFVCQIIGARSTALRYRGREKRWRLRPRQQYEINGYIALRRERRAVILRKPPAVEICRGIAPEKWKSSLESVTERSREQRREK